MLEVDFWVFKPAEMEFEAFPGDIAAMVQIPDPARRLVAARSRSILRRVLALRLEMPAPDIVFEIAAHGKPRVNGCEFSISHSGPWLVAVTGEMELGVDVETHLPRRDVMDLARRFFSNVDAEKLRRSANKAHDFLGQWVAKEAALKGAGVGLSGGLGNAKCTFDENSIREVSWDAQRFAIHEFNLSDGTRGAIAWRAGREANICWREAGDAGVS